MRALVLVVLATVFALCGAQTLTTPAVTFSNFVRNANIGCTSFNVNFQQPVSSLTTAYLSLKTSTGVILSLSSAALTPQSNYRTWTVSNSAGFNPSSPNTTLVVTFNNSPASICGAPVSLVNTTNATSVVGTGTPQSCTEAAFTAAVARGGVITFNCGSSPVTITLSQVKNVTLKNDTIIDGRGLITLSGNGRTRILAIQSVWNVYSPRVTLQNLAFINGYTTDVANTSATNTGGGALYRSGGSFTIINCDFSGSTGPATGQDVAGGAIYSWGGGDTTIVGSTFSGNKCSNGGGIGNLGNNFTLINSIVSGNAATGYGANPGHGGNGGGLCFDGAGVFTKICGSTVSYNGAHANGGAAFRVGYNLNDYVSITNTTLAHNNASWAGGAYLQGLTVNISNSTIMFNNATGAGGLALQSGASYRLLGVTLANNTASTSLGGAIFISSANGTLVGCTLTGNVATAAFDAGIYGGGNSTLLSSTIVAYGTAGNIYPSLNCGTTNAEGGNNFQWPAKRVGGGADTPCSYGVLFQDPQLSNVAANGCVTWTAPPAVGSPAAQSGASCVGGQSTPTPVLVSTIGLVIPRGPFSGSG